MFSRHLSRFCFATIKAKKPKNPTELSISNINECRSLLGMPTCERSDLLDKAVSYMKERSEVKLQKQSNDSIYKRWPTLMPLQCQINILASSKEMGSIESKYIYNIMTSWGNFLLQEQVKLKSQSYESRQSYKKMLIDYSHSLTTTCYLLDLDENMILIYLRIHFLVQSLRSQDKNQSHLRFIIDSLLKLKALSLDSVNFLLVFTSRFPMQNIYHRKEHEITKLIYSNLPNLSRQNKYNAKLTINLLQNLIKQSQISKEMKLLAINTYKNFSNNLLKFRAFHLLLEIFVIDKNNITQKANLQNIQDFVEQIPSQSFKFLTITLIRADIWLEEFWLPYFQYVSTDSNYKEIQDLTHFMVDDLLAEMKVGGKVLEKAALRFREFLKTKGIDIQKYDLRKEQERLYGRIKQNRHSCQMHVANSMRLICGAQILTEIPIKYFMVDVLVDKSIIVEINNTSHYKVIDGVTHLNLKSQFRQRILQQNGYKCYMIRVDDLSSSHYSMLEQVYKIVQSCGNMKRIVNGAPSTEKM